MARERRFLIVGGGLAGCWMAFWLRRAGARVLVVDFALPGRSSRVAAGMFHPLIGKRWSLRKDFGEQWEMGRELYGGLERRWGLRLWHELPVWRPFVNEWAHQRWLKVRGRAEIGRWLLDERADGVRYGGGGWVDVALFLDAMRAELEAEGCWEQLLFDEAELVRAGDGGAGGVGVGWRGEWFEGVVLCRGWREQQGMAGRHLSWRCCRGEIVEVADEAGARDEDCLWVEGGWRVPLGRGRWRCGSSYGWDDLPRSPARPGVRGLLAGLERQGWRPRLLKAVAGVRPIWRSDSLLVGGVEGWPGVHVLNSLGSHGTLRAPWAARRLAAQLWARD